MLYPREVIDDIRAGNDIVDVVSPYVQLKKKGGVFFGLCPFHSEKTPSFNVNPDRQFYHCFGCGAGGNVISFIMQIENYDFLDALKWLAGRINYLLPAASQDTRAYEARQRLRQINKLAARFYFNLLTDRSGADSSGTDRSGTDPSGESGAARQYLQERGILPVTRKALGLGFAPDSWDSVLKHLQKNGFTADEIAAAGLVKPNKTGGHYDRFRARIIFPIIDAGGTVTGFGGRLIRDGEPKYLNSPDTPLFDKSRQLYGIHTARKAYSDEIIIVEGYMDALALFQAGFKNTVGILGTALTAHHARALKRINCKKVVLLLDSDDAGTKAALRSIPILLEAGLGTKVLTLPNAKDPDEYLQKHGETAFRNLLHEAQSHILYRIEILRRGYNLENLEERVLFTEKCAEIISDCKTAIEADAYIQETSRLTGIAKDAIHREIQKIGRLKNAPSGQAPRRHRTAQNEQGIKKAKEALLTILFTNPQLAELLRPHLSPHEMGGEIFAKLLAEAYGENSPSDSGVSAAPAQPADIIARFETLEEQQSAARLFVEPLNFDSSKDLELELNKVYKLIKGEWIRQKIAETEQQPDEIASNLLLNCYEARKNLEKQYITISNG